MSGCVKTDVRREVIIKGVKDVEAALKHVGELDRALIFSRIVAAFQRSDASGALGILSKSADARGLYLRNAALRAELNLSDPTLDPRPVQVLALKEARS